MSLMMHLDGMDDWLLVCVKKAVIWGLLNIITVKFIPEAILDSS